MSEVGFDLDATPELPVQGARRTAMPQGAAAEEAMLAAHVESRSPATSTYEELKAKLLTTGTSEVTEGIRHRAAQAENKAGINQVLDAVGQGQLTLDKAEEILQSTPALTEDDITDLRREVARAHFMRSQAKTEEEKIQMEHTFQELVNEGKITAAEAISSRLDAYISKQDPSALNMVGGILLDSLPILGTARFRNAFKEVFGEGPGLTNLPRGELAMEFRRRLMEMDEETRYRTSVEFMEAIIENEEFISAAQFQNLMILQEALDPNFYQANGGINWDRVINNSITALDAVFLGGVARAIAKGSFRMFKPGSTLATVNTVDPEAAGGLAAAGIKSNMADALSMTPAEIVEQSVVPSSFRGQVELLPPNTVEMLNRNDSITQDLLERTVGNTQLMSPEDGEKALRLFRKNAEKVNTAGLYPSNFAAEVTDTGIKYRATYGVYDADGKLGTFRTPREAAEHAAEQFPTAKGIQIVPVKANGLFGKPLKPTKDAFASSKRTGKYVYTVEDSVPFSQVDGLANKLIFPEGSVVSSGRFSKYFLDPASRFAKWISNAFAQAGDYGRGVQHQINMIVEPFTRIPEKKRVATMHLLKKYEADGGTWDTAKLIQMADGDEDIINGFIAYRQADEALYELEARNLRNDMLRQDGRHIVEGKYQGVGIPVSEGGIFTEIKAAGKQGVEVFDPKKNSLRSMSATQAQNFFNKGGKIYRVLEKIPGGKEGNRYSNLVMISDAKQLRTLPAHILKKRPGHIARYYKDAYFIKRSVPGMMNGASRQVTQVLGVAKTKAEANALVNRFVASGKLTKEEAKKAIQHDRALSPEARATIDMQDKIALGRMFYHERADIVMPTIHGLAEVSDPVEALVKNIDSTARHVSEDELLWNMKARWMNTYGHMTPDSVFPRTADDLNSVGFTDAATKREATELWDQIDMAQRINTREGEVWRDSIYGFVDALVGKASIDTLWGKTITAITEPVRFLSDHSLNRIVRSLAFWHLIAANPVRQLYVQSQQFLFLWALNPVAGPKIVLKDGPAVMSAFLAKSVKPKMYNRLKPLWAKTLGMSTKEFDEFMDGYIKTGLPHSVDSHDYVANTLAQFSKNIGGGIIRRGGRAIWNAANTPLAWAKKAGFDMGELSNLTNTFMMARHRFLKETGKKKLVTRKDFETVAANARNLALDMTRTGAFRYQEGAFAALTQFLSIQHKALLAMNPIGKYGNQSFTRMERLRIAIGQVALNGATGIGLYEMYKKGRDHLGVDIPDEWEDYIVGGMYETVINEMLALATGEEQDFNIAGNIAPFSGVNAENLLEVMAGHKGLIEVMASWNVLNRYGDMARTMKAMMDYPELTGDEQLTAMVSNFASVTSGWNQAARARAALRLGVHVSNQGSPTVQSTYTSAMLEGLFGLQLRTVDEYYALADEYSNEYASTDLPWDSDKEISQIADNLYKSIMRITTLYVDEIDFEDMPGDQAHKLRQMQISRMQQTLNTHMSVLSIYEPIERDRIWQRLMTKATIDRTGGRRNLITNILKLIDNGDLYGHKAEVAINKLRNSGLYDPRSPEGRQWEHNMQLLLENMEAVKHFSDQNLKDIEKIYEQN